MDAFNQRDFEKYWKMIADVTDFWDFSGYNSISMDSKNFYDVSHYSNYVGELMMARMFNNKEADVPEDFGIYVTKENIDEVLGKKFNKYEYDSLKCNCE